MMRRRGWLTAAGLAGAAVAGGAAALRRADATWAAAPNPCAAGELLLPAGRSLTVATDDGAELAVTVAGDGPSVVLSHCWTGGREVWAPVAHRLISLGFEVVLYDQRGHGSSTVGDDGFAIPRLGGDLRAVLEAVDARDAVLAGHSMGGMAIQSLIAHHTRVAAERAAALVLVATAAGGLSRGALDRRMARAVGSRATERLLRHRYGHALVRRTFGAPVVRDHLVTTRDLFLACHPETRVGWLTAMQAMDLRDGVAEVELPTTITVGSRDTLTPPFRADELSRILPHARLEVLDGLGHMLPIEAPDETARLIADAAVADDLREAS